MRRLQLFAAVLVLIFSGTAVAQTDSTTGGGGNWNLSSTWQNGNVPSGAGTIIIRSGDSLYFNTAVTITGTVRSLSGRVGVYDSSKIVFASGSVYEHACNGGGIPKATWNTGSTCKITGFVSSPKPNNENQNFYNVIWNCPGQTGNVDMGLTGADTIHGDLTVTSTGTSRVYLTSPTSAANPITIAGNIIVNGGTFSSNGSSSTATIVVNTLGNITVTAGNFGVSRGSAPDVTWNLYGNFSVSNAILQNSGGTHVNKLSFAGTGTHNVTLDSVTFGTGSSPFTVEVQSGTIVDFGTSVITKSNTGSFLLLNGGTLETGNAGGIDSTIQATGASNGGGNSFSNAANYAFNGSTAQVTGMLMPDTVNNLTINNKNGVTLSQATIINGTLTLTAGQFDNTIPFTLGPNAKISYGGGTLKIPVTLVPIKESTIPQKFFVDQNYPNPFNPSTTISYGIPRTAFVTVKIFNVLGQEVKTLFSGYQSTGVYTLSFNASDLGSGVYLYRIQAGTSVDIKRMVLVK